MGRKIETSKPLKPSPDLILTENPGNYVKGTLTQRFPSTAFKGKFSYLIAVEDTNAPTRLWNKETREKIDVDIAQGDLVFLRDSTVLNKALAQVTDGERISITYTGLGAKKPGQKPPFLFEVEVL